MRWIPRHQKRTATFEHHSDCGNYVIKPTTAAVDGLKWETWYQGRSIGHFRYMHQARRHVHKHDVAVKAAAPPVKKTPTRRKKKDA